MRIFLRKIASAILPEAGIARLKKAEFKFRKDQVRKSPPIGESAFQEILADKLDIHPGDNVFVHSSASMLNLSFDKHRFLQLILDYIGKSALVCAPAFPRMSSRDFLSSEAVFDYRSEPSGMGAFSEMLRCLNGAHRSNHPVKSIIAYGEGAAEIAAGHEDSEYAFDRNSPYFKLMNRGIKIIGLGAEMSYLTFVHVYEDCNRSTFPVEVYGKQAFLKRITMTDGSVEEKRYFAHNLDVVRKANPEKFVRKHVSPSDFALYKHYHSPFFSVSGKALYEAIGAGLPDTIYS